MTAAEAAAPDGARIEEGRTGRILYARVRPNEDLAESVAALARAHGFATAFVRGSLGSLVQGVIETPGGARRTIAGPAVEVMALSGEVRGGVPDLFAALVDMEGRAFGGRLVSGENPVCVTFELTLEEWIPGTDGPAA